MINQPHPRTRAWRHSAWLALLTALVGAACGPQAQVDQPAGPDQGDPFQAPLVQTAIASTVEAQVARTVEAMRVSASPTPEPVPSRTPPDLSATPPSLTISVSLNTNCRSGPAASYDYRGVLMAGESARVVARSTVENYWYIENPDVQGERCWLWDEYATLQGDPSGLPLYTPAPSPTPALDFVLFFNRVQTCGSDTYVHLTFQNTGGTAFMSGQISIVDLDNGGKLYGPVIDRHPFGAAPTCPADHGNYVGPGSAAYITADIDPAPTGHFARATVKACTQDYAGGDCLTKTIDFQLP